MALSFNGKSKPVKKPTTVPTPVVKDDAQSGEEECLHTIAKPLKTPPKSLAPFKSKRDALRAMITYGATRSTYNSKGKLVSTVNVKAVVEGTMLMTNTQYIFKYKNDLGTEVHASGLITGLELTDTSVQVTCYDGNVAVYEVRKNK